MSANAHGGIVAFTKEQWDAMHRTSAALYHEAMRPLIHTAIQAEQAKARDAELKAATLGIVVRVANDEQLQGCDKLVEEYAVAVETVEALNREISLKQTTLKFATEELGRLRSRIGGSHYAMSLARKRLSRAEDG